MKTKQIVFGVMLVSLVCFMGKSALAAPEPAILLFLFVIAIAAFLLPLFVYQMKNDIAKMQKTIDGLAAELKRTREVLEEQKEPLQSKQEVSIKDVERTLWDELGQAEKDEHIAKIQRSMEYTGSTSPSRKDMGNGHDIIPLGA